MFNIHDFSKNVHYVVYSTYTIFLIIYTILAKNVHNNVSSTYTLFFNFVHSMYKFFIKCIIDSISIIFQKNEHNYAWSIYGCVGNFLHQLQKKWEDWTFNIQTMKECTQFFIFKLHTQFYIIIVQKIPKNVHNSVYWKPSKNAILYIQRRQFFK